MDRTSIQCPTCNQNISIALRPPLCSLVPLDLNYSHVSVPIDEEHNLRDILYVHEELIMENKYLRKKINELNSKLYGNSVSK